MYKGTEGIFDTGEALIRMLDGCQHRGPDSTGFALYGEANPGELKLRFFLGTASDSETAIDTIRKRLLALEAVILDESENGDN